MKRKNLIKFRIDHDLTQEQLAESLDVSTSHINQIELGKGKPSYGLLMKFKQVYKVDDVLELFIVGSD